MENHNIQQTMMAINHHQAQLAGSTNSSSTSYVLIQPNQSMATSIDMKDNINNNNINNNSDTKTEEQQSPNPVRSCASFSVHKPKQPGLRANVFVSKDCTRDLAKYIVDEYWGHDNGMLYKYLDYIFRCQIFDQQVKKINFFNESEIVVFHTGLQRRADHNFLYFVLMPNDADKKNAEQRWRVPAGGIADSCVSQEELKMKWFLNDIHLPKRTKFYSNLNELLFDETYQIEVNWSERLRTNRERIYHELKTNSKDIDKAKLVQELTQTFTIALKKAENRAKANPRLAVAQGFVETKHYKKRVELLLPLNVEYPKGSGIEHTFALALRKSQESNVKKYTGMSLLTMSMAYANARLVGYVDSSWLVNTEQQENCGSSPANSIGTNSVGNASMYAPAYGKRGNHFLKKLSIDNTMSRSRGVRGPRYPGHDSQLHNYHGSIPEDLPVLAVIDSHSHQSKVYPMEAINAVGSMANNGSLDYNINNMPHRTIKHNQYSRHSDHHSSNSMSKSLHYAKSMPHSNPPDLHHKIEESHLLDDLDETDDYQFEKQIVDDVFESDIKIPRSAPPKPHYMFEEKDFNDLTITESSPASSLNGHKSSYLLQVGRLPADCGVNMLRQIFGVIGDLRSVHYVHEDKIAILRFSNESSMAKAHDFGSRFGWKIIRINSNSKRSKMLAYRDQQTIWEFQTSTSWTPHPPDFAAVVDRIPERSSMYIKYMDSTYYIERYNDRQGQQTNCRTKNQRMIRRITILVWAPPTSSMRKEMNAYVDPLMEFYWGTYHQPPRPAPMTMDHHHHETMHRQSQMGSHMQYEDTDQLLNAGASVFKPTHVGYNNRSQHGHAQPMMMNHNKKKLSMARSVPPEISAYYNTNARNAINPTMNVRAQQTTMESRVSGLHKAKENGNHNMAVVMDTKSYFGSWKHMKDYDEQIKELKTGQIGGIWSYKGQQQMPANNEMMDTEYLWFSGDWEETQEIFESGFTIQNGMYTFFENVLDACGQCDEASNDGDIRLFQCKLFLDSKQQYNCKQQRSVMIRDYRRIHFVCCVQVNKDILENAIKYN